MTPMTCRLCQRDVLPGWPICPTCAERWEASPEARRRDGIVDEYDAERAAGECGHVARRRANLRIRVALSDYITRVLAERDVEKGR